MPSGNDQVINIVFSTGLDGLRSILRSLASGIGGALVECCGALDVEHDALVIDTLSRHLTHVLPTISVHRADDGCCEAVGNYDAVRIGILASPIYEDVFFLQNSRRFGLATEALVTQDKAGGQGDVASSLWGWWS